MPLASQKSPVFLLSGVYSLISRNGPSMLSYACVNQRQTNLTRYWWQPQSADSNFHIPSMAHFSPTTWPDCGGCLSSPRVSLGTSPWRHKFHMSAVPRDVLHMRKQTKKKWRPTLRLCLDMLESRSLLGEICWSYEDSMAPWTCAPRSAVLSC